jgi:hypothetical protein
LICREYPTRGRDIANKKFPVRLSGGGRERLSELTSKGKGKTKTILKVRILLKADQGEAGEGWADEEICRALDTNVTMVARVREKLVTEGLDAVLARKKRETPPPSTADHAGVLEAAGRPRSLDDPLVGGAAGRRTQDCRERALQYGRSSAKKKDIKPHLKEHWVIPPKANAGFVAQWRTCWRSTPTRTTRTDRSCAWTRPQNNSSQKRESRFPFNPGERHVTTTNTSATARPACSCCLPRSKDGATSQSPSERRA